MRVSIVSFTPKGHALSARIAAFYADAERVVRYGRAEELTPYASLDALAAQAMAESDLLIFVGATGIAVRAIAPHIRRKDIDPAVLVADEGGQFVISLLSGHIGGANAQATALAQAIGARPVITTATDANGVFAADSWGVAQGCAIPFPEEIKHISAALLRGEQVGFQSDFPISGSLPAGVVYQSAENGILVSMDTDRQPFAHTLHLVPRVVQVGVGCKRGTEPERLCAFVQDALHRVKIHPCAVETVCSIEVKRDETAVCQLADQLRRTLRFYTAQELEQAPGDFPASAFVRRTVGTDNVCQRAAALASGNGRCILPKTAQDGMTVSIYCKEWRAFF